MITLDTRSRTFWTHVLTALLFYPFLQLAQSYQSILDSTDSRSRGSANGNHGRPTSAASTSTDGGISSEAMASMQQNATYAMQMLENALKTVRGVSPAGSGSGPSPVAGLPAQASGIRTSPLSHSAGNPNLSSSLSGAIPPASAAAPQPQQATAPPTAPSSSGSVPAQASPKSNKESVGIRVIEDGPLKRAEAKENGGKGKRQVRRSEFGLRNVYP